MDKDYHTTKEFYGHVAKMSAAPATLVISIRGTSDAQEWLDDAKFLMTDYSDNPDFGRVEEGFREIFASFTVSLPGEKGSTSLGNFLAGFGDIKRLIVVGHSLGSSLATLVAFDADVSNYAGHVQLLNFASPLTGDARFVKAFQHRIKDSVRLVNEPDLVPRVPPPLFGYRHIWHELKVDSHQQKSIERNVGCYHSLLTYLHMLDSNINVIEQCKNL